jgi:hypothetical protein
VEYSSSDSSNTLWNTFYNVLTQLAINLVPNVMHGAIDEDDDSEMEIMGSSLFLFHSLTKTITEELTDAFMAAC